MTAPFPIEEAVAVLARAAATEASTPSSGTQGVRVLDATELHLRAARALDVLAARGIVVVAERLVPMLAGLDEDPAHSVLDLLIALLRESDRVAQAVADRARAMLEDAARNVSSEAAAAHAARRVLLDPALEIGRYLPRAVALQNEFRREELVRAWAAAIGAPVESKRKLEAADKSKRALERLDYRKIRADEERLAVERRVLSEHADRVRAKQQKDAAEALANAQRE